MKIFTLSEKGMSFSGLILFLGCLLCMTGSLKAQIDDPNLDQLPRSMWKNVVQPAQTDNPLSSVLTINNWDNFNITATSDFGESNVATNPNMPTWFFTAYNTNQAKHTENGHDWASNSPSFGATMSGDPVVAYDSLGNLYYENMYGSSIQGCKVIKSTNNGATWGPSVTAIAGNDKNWIACDQTSGPYANYVYTTMTNNGAGNFARSIDGGATFQSTFAPSTQSLPGMMVCVGPKDNIQGGAVYVVTNSGTSFASTYTFYRSTDGGQNFTMMSAQQFSGYVGTNVGGRNSVQGMRTRPYPFITADNSYGAHRGRLYLVYASNDPPGDAHKPDVWCRYSDNGGTTWSSAVRVNDDPNTTTHHQWHPATWCDKETGKLYIQWMDTRDCPTSDSALIYATYSTDGGQTFVQNQAVSNKKMKIDCPTCGGGGNPRYQGDYNGIISNKKVSMAGWTDFRNGTFMSAVSYFPDFAMAVDKASDTLWTPIDSITVNVSVPEVKLYSDTVLLSGTVNPTPTTGSITFDFPAGNKITTYPDTKPVTIKVLGVVPEGNYQAFIYASGPNGTPVHRRLITLYVRLGDDISVIASASPDSLCTGSSSQLNTQLFGGTGPFTYSWTPVEGLSNPAIPDPVATPLTTTQYKVTVTDNSSSKFATDSILITVNFPPANPGMIIGPGTVCRDSSATYSIIEIPGATSYSWSVPEGAVINSGQNTTSINVTLDSISGSISVLAGNDCGNSNPGVVEVTVEKTPDAPVLISGPDTTCLEAGVIYSIEEVPGATSYSWTVPEGVTITTVLPTTSINVLWGTEPGDISVVAQNSCGVSNPAVKSVAIERVPGDPDVITGEDTVCVTQTYTYSIESIAGADSYSWTLPQGANIISGSGTESIQVQFTAEAQSGNFTVLGQNNCGDGNSVLMGVFVKTCAGIHDQDLNASISVFPNPTTGMVNVLVNGVEKQLDMSVLNVHGQTILSETWNQILSGSSRQIDMTGFAKGVYYIRFTNNSKTLVQKIVLQ